MQGRPPLATLASLLAASNASLVFGRKSKRVAAKLKRVGSVRFRSLDARLLPSPRLLPAVFPPFSLQCAPCDLLPRMHALFSIAHSFPYSFTSFIIALGELPFCLGWIPSVKLWSASVAPYLEQYWARSLVYTGFVNSVALYLWSANSRNVQYRSWVVLRLPTRQGLLVDHVLGYMPHD